MCFGIKIVASGRAGPVGLTWDSHDVVADTIATAFPRLRSGLVSYEDLNIINATIVDEHDHMESSSDSHDHMEPTSDAHDHMESSSDAHLMSEEDHHHGSAVEVRWT